MKEKYSKEEVAKKIRKCAKEYESNLKNKNVLFIIENKDKSLSMLEATMFPRNFKHLTGVEIIENGKKLNSKEFYKRCLKDSINTSNVTLKNSTSYYKLKVLPQLVNLDKTAKMIGEYNNSRIYLQTDKIIGNVNASMGFIKEKYTYVPNTALNLDIRRITNNTKKVVGIMKKDIKEEKYKEITYLKSNYEIIQILKNYNIKEVVDYMKIRSKDRLIVNKINKFEHELIKLFQNVKIYIIKING